MGDLEDGEPGTLEAEDKRQRWAFGFVHAGELVANLRPVSWLVRGYVEADSLALVYGEPGHGKSFLAIDMAASIATGIPWHGAETKAGAVFYIAGEGHNGLSRRLKAWETNRGTSLRGAPLYVSQQAAPLDNKESAAEVLRVVDEQAAEAEQAPALIVVDTLARCFGGDENSATDIGAFVANLDALRHRWRATVLVVHHSGKDSTRGARGSTALRGAVDAEYRVTKDRAGVVSLEAGKMKDGDTPERRAFRLAPVEMPLVDDDGEPVWSCVPEPVEAPTNPEWPKGGNQQKALRALENLASLPDDDEEHGISLASWRQATGLASKPFKRAKDSLAALGWVRIDEDKGRAWLLHSL